ncbi:SDR family oxidoreductase [Sphingosinicella soli]|uniref:NAD(P)-dependent dehydrogenase (Short-subunit alcohol dehydrogenase family) n=1 Tax=Sphingosinicella soli TaxID=333708 RepID=A0A7W7F6U2_9SPHN|nr:SDR family oxidoreductase [Sphingosinicella soli]MBB4632676.1 NAD(P)-dependent dehydrogenase (short-subunit alcohol dehydrogenase family) [Sphingosinicella soli]
MNSAANEKVVVVTGGSRNIGLAAAHALASRGYRLAILGRGLEALNEAAAGLGGETLPVSVDITDHDALNAAFDDIVEHFGRIDGLVNNAGIAHLGKTEALDPKQVIEQVNLNFLATVFACKAVIPHLCKQGGGRIVNVSSAASKFEVFSHLGIYGATKAAVDRFTDELRREMYPENIGVTCFIPGDTQTSFGFGWDPRLAKEAYDVWLDSGKYFQRAMDVEVVGESIARCFDLPPGAAYDTIVLRPFGQFPKEMLPE